jgi:hypothetical protein
MLLVKRLESPHFLLNQLSKWNSIWQNVVTPIEHEINDGTGYEYDGNVFVAWVLQVRRAEVVTK